MRLRTRVRAVALIVAMALASSAGFTLARPGHRAGDAPFPHLKHVKLFPTCAGCHGGLSTGDSASMFPPASACAECHNGKDVKTVAWTYSRRTPTNLRFDHARHLRPSDSSSPALTCTQCHGEGAVWQQMLIAKPQPETCIGCHAHPASAHLAVGSPCATCHVPLVRAVEFTDSAVAALPKPPTHAAKDFLATHGAQAAQSTQTCATCHARESCARCHVNADASKPIQSLGSDARVARLVRELPARYFTPSSHQQRNFSSAHGALARANIETCATCHTQPSCRTCHTGPLGASAIDALLPAAPGRARGVQLVAPRQTPLPPWSADGFTARAMGAARPVAATDSPPPRVVRAHPSDIVRTHGAKAASGRLTCMGCHTQESFCTNCHQSAGERRYHPVNFVSRHPSEAYARDVTCTSCHNSEQFCQSCHRNVAGIAAGSNKRAGPAHSGQPVWFLQHGEAARRGMSSCASCHQQTDCMKCHSAAGAKINPHGPNFDADRMRKKNPTLCAYCHVTTPH